MCKRQSKRRRKFCKISTVRGSKNGYLDVLLSSVAVVPEARISLFFAFMLLNFQISLKISTALQHVFRRQYDVENYANCKHTVKSFLSRVWHWHESVKCQYCPTSIRLKNLFISEFFQSWQHFLNSWNIYIEYSKNSYEKLNKK